MWTLPVAALWLPSSTQTWSLTLDSPWSIQSAPVVTSELPFPLAFLPLPCFPLAFFPSFQLSNLAAGCSSTLCCTVLCEGWQCMPCLAAANCKLRSCHHLWRYMSLDALKLFTYRCCSRYKVCILPALAASGMNAYIPVLLPLDDLLSSCCFPKRLAYICSISSRYHMHS